MCGGEVQTQGVSVHYRIMYQAEKRMKDELCLGYIQAIVTQAPCSCCAVKGGVRSSLSDSVFSESLKVSELFFFSLNLPMVSNQTTCKSS